VLQKIIITTQCVKEGYSRGYGGLDIHGWFFNKLQGYDPLISKRFHELEDKPFAIGPLTGAKRQKGQTVLLMSGDYSFSVAGLNGEACNILNEMVGELPGTVMRLGSADLMIKEVKTLFRDQGLAYQEILEKTKPRPSFRLEFRSPTSFRRSGSQFVFPFPEMIFQNLWRRWNIFSELNLPEVPYFSQIQVSRYKLETQLLDFGEYKIIGFVGECVFQTDRKLTEDLKNIVHSLGYFASIAGVGYKTSMGLGDTRFYT
jgi:CRISPR-associated endoribonuclease Cas6